MTSHQRIESFARLGAWLRTEAPSIQHHIEQAQLKNPWFTSEQVSLAIEHWKTQLAEEALERWIDPHLPDLEEAAPLQVGLILAGNIPLVGWHDILTCLIAGFRIQVKPSSADAGLTTWLLQELQGLAPEFSSSISVVKKLQNYDAIIATGSNNSARYFEYYFSKVPHIIRKNRNGVAVLTGKEPDETLSALGADIFTYFGLGCRNVSKLYVPKGYDFRRFFEAIAGFESQLTHHHKYRNNYDYYKSIYLVNGDTHLDNGFLLLKPDQALASPLSVVYYESYDSDEALHATLIEKSEEIQCIVSSGDLSPELPVVPFGQAQHPGLNDFADRVPVFEFLKAVKQGRCTGKFVA